MAVMQGNGIVGAALAGVIALAAGAISLPVPASAQSGSGGVNSLSIAVPPQPPKVQPDFNRLLYNPPNINNYVPNDDVPGPGDNEPRIRILKNKPHEKTDLTRLVDVRSLGVLMAPGVISAAPEPNKASVLHKLENRLPLMAPDGASAGAPPEGRGAALAALDNAKPIF